MEKSRTLFQFHKGTIKTIILQMQNNILMKFQFHKGTIKTAQQQGQDDAQQQFQFHKGTIKTYWLMKDGKIPYLISIP